MGRAAPPLSCARPPPRSRSPIVRKRTPIVPFRTTPGSNSAETRHIREKGAGTPVADGAGDPMDRALPADFIQQRRRRRTIGATAGVALAAIAFLWLPGLVRPALSRERLRTSRIDRGAIEAVITASGTVVPEVEQVVASPVDARVLRILKRAGDAVAMGEPIVELDLSASRVALAKLDQDLALKRNAQKRTGLDLRAKLADTQAKWDVKKLQLESYRSQLRRYRELHAQGLLSQEALQQSELSEAQAGVELRQIEADRASAQESARAEL